MAKRKTSSDFPLCVRNEGYPASLEVRKLYRAIPDAAALSRGLLRIVDESGEDYLYPKDFFISIALPPAARKAIIQAG